MFNNAYKGRRVFITGHTGFKGSWLAAWLLELGAEVTGYALEPPSTPSAFAVLELEKRIRHIHGDVRDAAGLARAVQQAGPEIVFHLAAQALVRPSYEDAPGTFAINAMGTLNLLEAVRACPGIGATVCITSDKCYRNDEWVWGYRETDHLGGDDPYSASKACAEIIAHSYFKSFFANGPAAATVRAGNVIGGGDWALDRIVPDCARAWTSGKPTHIRSPHATRPWQHVLEPLSGYLHLGAMLLSGREGNGGLPLRGQAFNFGPPSAVNAEVLQVAETLKNLWPGFDFFCDPSTSAGKKECTLLKLCCDKSLAHLGWRAVLDFAETMRFTAQWYQAHADGKEMYAYTAGQIAEYAGKARLGGLSWNR